MNIDNKSKEENKGTEHYICLGGCRGVSETSGICQAVDCGNHKHELIRCSCTDDRHYDFKHA